MNDMLLPLIHAVEQAGFLLDPFPSSVRRLMPAWPGANAQAREFSFGMIAAVSFNPDIYNNYLYRYIILKESTEFTFEQDKGGLYLHLRKKGKVDVEMERSNYDWEEMTCSILYIPEGVHHITLECGLSVGVTVKISAWLLEGISNPHIIKLLSHIKETPEIAFKLPELPINYWIMAALNLVLNNREPLGPDMNRHTKLLIDTYLIELSGKSAEIRAHHHLSRLTGRQSAKPTMTGFDPNWEVYEDIITRLPEVMKDNFTKKEIARKKGLSEKTFSRIFRDGYGKPFKEGYVDLKMMKALELVVQDQKLSTVGESIGYTSASNFTAEFRKFFGYPPSSFQSPGLH